MSLLVYVALPGGTVPIEVPADGTVKDLKLAIEAAGGPPASLQELRSGDAELSLDSVPLADSGLSSEAMLGVNTRRPRATVAAGGPPCHCVACGRNGVVKSWGSPEMPPPPDISGRVVSVAAGSNFCLAATEKGRLALWGRVLFGQITMLDKKVEDVAAGPEHALAVCETTGKVLTWGRCERAPRDLVATAVAAGGTANTPFSAAVTPDGKLEVWGPTPEPPDMGRSRVVDLAMGYQHCVAVTDDGSLVLWGGGDHGQLTPPDGLGKVSAVAAGGTHTVVIDSHGKIHQWGEPALPLLEPLPEPAVAVACSPNHIVVRLLSGRIVSWPDRHCSAVPSFDDADM
eukprot:Hpha_TRINITY_DN10235_c0_g1::TRINITY_DN10235_c0_g1_i1::g.35233::m.35233